MCYGLPITSIDIPGSVNSIGVSAFRECEDLTSVTIPNNLTSVKIGNRVTSIGDYAFSGCSGLPFVTIPNRVTDIGIGAFYGCTGMSALTIGNSVQTIWNGAFYGCSNLKSVTIPGRVNDIGPWAFSNCASLSSLTIGNSVQTIWNGAFYGCSNLKSIVIPNSVTSIEESAFEGCTELAEITLGSGLQTMKDSVFKDCKRIMDIKVYSERLIDITESSFYNIGNKKYVYVYVPDGCLRNYQRDPYWNEFDLRVMGATEVTNADESIVVIPADNSADIIWPQVTNANSYELVIRDANNNVICILTFNAQGYLSSIAFAAPSRNNGEQEEEETVAGFNFTITSLNSGSTYAYVMTAKDNKDAVIDTKSGTFKTTGNDPMGIDEISTDKMRKCENAKIMRDGVLYIERDGEIYNTQGARVK